MRLMRHEPSSKKLVGYSYAECDRIPSPNNDDNFLDPDCRKVRKKTILTKLIRTMIKKRDEDFHRAESINLHPASDLLEESISDDDIDFFADPNLFSGQQQIGAGLTMGTTPAKIIISDTRVTDKSQENKSIAQEDHDLVEDVTVASTPPDNLLQNDNIEGISLVENEILGECKNTEPKISATDMVENLNGDSECFTVEDCLRDIVNLERSTIPEQISMSICDSDSVGATGDENMASRKLFYEEEEVLKELAGNSAAYFETPKKTNVFVSKEKEGIGPIIETKPISSHTNANYAPIAIEEPGNRKMCAPKEHAGVGLTVETNLNSNHSNVKVTNLAIEESKNKNKLSRQSSGNSNTDNERKPEISKIHGLHNFEMNYLWDAAKDVMKAFNLHTALEANTLDNSACNDENHHVRKALEKYDFQDSIVDQIMRDVTVGHSSKNVITVVQDHPQVINRPLKASKTSSDENWEAGTELKYKTPQKGPKRKQMTVILPNGDKAEGEVLATTLDDSDVFSFDSPDKSICVKAREKETENLDSFKPFSSFNIKEVLHDPKIPSDRFEREDSEFVVFSPFTKRATDMEEVFSYVSASDYSAVATPDKISKDNDSSCMSEVIAVMNEFGSFDSKMDTPVHDNIVNVSRNEELSDSVGGDQICDSSQSTAEMKQFTSFDSKMDTPVRQNIENASHGQDERFSTREEDDIEEHFPSPVWSESYPRELWSRKDCLNGRKLCFDDLFESGKGKEGILSEANSLLLSLQNITLGAITVNREKEPALQQIDDCKNQKRDVTAILQLMKDECVHRLEHDTTKTLGLRPHRDDDEPQSMRCHDENKNNERSLHLDEEGLHRKTIREPLQVGEEVAIVIGSHQSPLAVMDFPVDEVVENVSHILHLKRPEVAEVAVETFSSPLMQRGGNEEENNSTPEFDEAVKHAPNSGASTEATERTKTTEFEISMTISERIAQLQKNFRTSSK